MITENWTHICSTFLTGNDLMNKLLKFRYEVTKHITVQEDVDSSKINLSTEESLPFAYLDLF